MNFPRLTNKDTEKLYTLSNLLCEIAFIKDNPAYSSLLTYFDSSSGVNQVVAKLPYNIQTKWVDRASRYKTTQKVFFPLFTFFVNFVKVMTKRKWRKWWTIRVSSQPHIIHQRRKNLSMPLYSQPIRVRKMDVSSESVCSIHKTNHSLNHCKTFRAKPIQVRRKFLSETKYMYAMDVVTQINIWNVIVKRERNLMTVVVKIIHLFYMW